MYSSIQELLRHKALLQMEYEFDKKSFDHQSSLVSIEKKVEAGICRYPISLGNAYFNSLNQYVVEVRHRVDDEEREDQFEYGRSVEFFSVSYNGDIRRIKIESSISYATPEVALLTLPDRNALLALQSYDRLGVQISFDESSYRAMFTALDKVINASDGRLFELREILAGDKVASNFSFRDVRFPWINASQEQAVNKILRAKDVAIVHGPPGTGKTTTLVEAIYETLRRETQVMVCAQSNMAVDWISEQLVDRGVPVLRIGNPSRVDDKMLSFTYERQFESHPQYATLWGMRKTMRELYKTNKEKAQAMRERAESLEYEIRESLFSETRVVACTLVGAANKLLLGRTFQSLFIDEAAQAIEAACWIPICKSHRVIFAGDHMQLPPTIKCYEADKAGLSTTLMEKLAKKKPEAVSLLTLQYRMNEEIMKFSSEWFYDGQLQAADVVKNRGVMGLENPIEWIDTAQFGFQEEFVAQTAGRINRMEGELTISVIAHLIERIGMTRVLEERLDFGVISPYKAQVHFLRHLLKHEKALKQVRRQITINSVDGFQGQERDVVIISLVRSNDEGEIGFLRELRRMNVAMTRARMKLIIIGNAETLGRHKFYRELWKRTQEASEQ